MSLKNIELGLKRPVESFPSIKHKSVAGWEYACLSQKTAKFKVWNQGFHSVGKVDTIYLVPDCKCAMVNLQRNALLSNICKTSFKTKMLDPSSVA